MTEIEALTTIRDAGFAAFTKTTSRGDIIGCGVISAVVDEITQYSKLVHICPSNGKWTVDPVGVPGAKDENNRMTLEDATSFGVAILSSPHIPFRANEIEITLARSEGGESSWMIHKPTGIRRILFRPEDGTRREFRTRQEAFREIFHAVARVATNTEPQR